VNKHRSWTPGLREANLLIYFVNLADNRGPDRRRPGPHPERISSRYIKALRSSELGSRFGAYSQTDFSELQAALLLADRTGWSSTPSTCCT